MSDRRDFTITRLEKHPDGHWEAWVSSPDTPAFRVDNRYGSWQADVRRVAGSRTFNRRFVLPPVAAALQEKVRRAERRGEVPA